MSEFPKLSNYFFKNTFVWQLTLTFQVSECLWTHHERLQNELCSVQKQFCKVWQKLKTCIKKEAGFLLCDGWYISCKFQVYESWSSYWTNMNWQPGKWKKKNNKKNQSLKVQTHWIHWCISSRQILFIFYGEQEIQQCGGRWIQQAKLTDQLPYRNLRNHDSSILCKWARPVRRTRLAKIRSNCQTRQCW